MLLKISVSYTHLRAHETKANLYESVGKAYADFYIFAIYCLTPVEHNEEFEELYRELSNNEQ